MKMVEFFVSFRSVSHLYWLFVAMTWFGIIVWAYAKLMRTGKYSGAFLATIYFAAIEFLVAGIAVIATKGGTVNGPTWSVDCIWFNGAMGGIYLMLALIALAIQAIDRSAKHNK